MRSQLSVRRDSLSSIYVFCTTALCCCTAACGLMGSVSCIKCITANEVSVVSQERFSEFNICFLHHCTVLLYSCLWADGIRGFICRMTFALDCLPQPCHTFHLCQPQVYMVGQDTDPHQEGQPNTHTPAGGRGICWNTVYTWESPQ